MVFKEINNDPSLYCNSCFSRVAKVTVRFGTANNAIAVRLCGECYGKLSSSQQEEPKWHKVADGDLPKDENDVLVYSGEDWRMCVGRYSPKYKAWEAGCDTIAWCEIPKYTEE